MLAAVLGAVPAACAPPRAAISEPQDVTVSGAYRHPASGMAFPDTVAGFRRVRVARLAADGGDAAVAYDFTGAAGEIAATVYVHPAPTMFTVGQSADAVADLRARACAEMLDARDAAIRRDHLVVGATHRRGVSLVKDGTLRRGTQIASAYVATFAGRTQAVRTELDLFCFVRGRWTLEFRFSAPEAFDAAPRIAAFMGALDWTGLE